MLMKSEWLACAELWSSHGVVAVVSCCVHPFTYHIVSFTNYFATVLYSALPFVEISWNCCVYSGCCAYYVRWKSYQSGIVINIKTYLFHIHISHLIIHGPKATDLRCNHYVVVMVACADASSHLLYWIIYFTTVLYSTLTFIVLTLLFEDGFFLNLRFRNDRNPIV